MNLVFLFPNIFVFIFGLCIGSFLNAVIYRLNQKKTLKGRSICPVCKHQLEWRDLVPVFSFLVLGRKCRYCKEKISWQYPLVEIVTAVIFLIIFNINLQSFILSTSSFGGFLYLAFLFYIASVFVIILFYDLNYYIIPDKILFPAIIITALYRLSGLINWDLLSILSYVFAVIIGAGFFLTIFLFSKGRWMGFGDVKLAVLMGLLLGFPNILAALFMAFLSGAVVGSVLLILKKKGLKSEIPFGPFLVLGTFIALFWGDTIINWYMAVSF